MHTDGWEQSLPQHFSKVLGWEVTHQRHEFLHLVGNPTDRLIRALALSKSAAVENVEAGLRLEPSKESDPKLVPGDKRLIDCSSLGSALEVHDGIINPGFLSRISPKRQTDSTLGHGERWASSPELNLGQSTLT